MIYCFDIDGTLCTNTYGEYERAEPYEDMIRQVNALYHAGHEIVLCTARGTTTGIDWRAVTERQLNVWGVNYHSLFFGKPQADVYIDDRGMSLEEWKVRSPLESPNGAASVPAASVPAASVPAASAPADDAAVMATSSYLQVTYSTARAPYGKYPYLLTKWLLDNVYKQKGRLLDLGCGRGEHLLAFNRLGFETAGVDMSPAAPELAQNCEVRVANLETDALPFPAESFDFVFSKSVVEHMRQPHALLTKALEALRPGGIAVIMTPSWEHTHWGPFYIDHTHVTPFTAPSLADAMTIAGFESVQSSHFYQLPRLWRYPWLKPVVRTVAALPIPYRPYQSAPWADELNKFIRFSKELMLLGIGRKPLS